MILRAIALIFFAIAFLQWITFTYPEVNPLYPGGLFTPGMLDNNINIVVVVALAGIGLLLWNAAKRGWKL